MQRCRTCGAEIDDTQALEFDGRCPACVRLGQGSHRDEPPQNAEASIWLIVMIAGGLIAVSSLVMPLMMLPWSGYFPTWPAGMSTLMLMGSLPEAVFGIIGMWFGHHMYRKTSRKTNV